ncbi:unnamed protein product [Discosporangium mesarthrocarpum]
MIGTPCCRDEETLRATVLALIAHKMADFVCHGGGACTGRRAIKPPRLERPHQPELDAVGIIVSATHPDSGIFLVPAVVDHIIKGFSFPGDTVQVTAVEKNDLASLALGKGRPYMGLVADAAKAEAVSDHLATACAAAVDRGWFSDLHQQPVTVGMEHPPECAPVTIISTNAGKKLAD